MRVIRSIGCKARYAGVGGGDGLTALVHGECLRHIRCSIVVGIARLLGGDGAGADTFDGQHVAADAANGGVAADVGYWKTGGSGGSEGDGCSVVGLGGEGGRR